MVDYMNEQLENVVKAILEDGIIDDNEVEELRKRLYADGIIDQDEAEALFQINNGVSGKTNSAKWAQLFSDGICDYLLKDEVSPGEIDDEEAKWLIEHLEGDGQIDAVEKVLLSDLRNKAKKVSKLLLDKMAEWKV